MEKITCTKCGTENSAKNKYCMNCGYEIEQKEDSQPIEKKEKQPQKRNTSKLIGTISGVVTFFLAYFLVQHFFFGTPSFDEVLVKSADEINKTCPMMVDQYTRLDNANALPNNTFQYNYTLIENTVDEVNMDTVAKYMKPGIIHNVKTNPDLKLFRDNNVTLVYSYRDKNGAFVMKYNITPDLYK